MNRKMLMRIFMPAMALILLALPGLSGCSSPQYTIKTFVKSGLGEYLVDANGMTLYYWEQDLPGKSNASAAVLEWWPVFYAGNISIPSSLKASDFGTITRGDGTKQTTYFGWPLYRFAFDKAAGDTFGNDVGEPVFLSEAFVAEVGFYSVATMAKGAVRTYLADHKGMTLYYNTGDAPGESTVTGAVLANWPVFNPPSFVISSEFNISDFSTITREDGAKQATYKGFPLYYYINDKVPGDTLGQGVKNVWYVIDPDNFSPYLTERAINVPQ